MGAWDTGNFSNDSALDYLAEIKSMDDIRRPIADVMSGAGAYIEVDMACEALAAADLLACLLGRAPDDLPKEAKELSETLGKPPDDLLELSRAAVTSILTTSELAELWGEGDDQEWKDVVDNLLKRLDPDKDYQPKKPEKAATGGFVCSVCDDVVSEKQLVRAEIGFLNLPGITMGRYFHRDCIERNFKPPFYDKNGEVRASLKKQIKNFLKIKDKG